jgi:osmotically-inducible protein OsmY
MRRKVRSAVTAAAALLMTFSVLAAQTPTPMDQGTSKSDVSMTARIRKEVVALKDMSVNARNVQIVTNEGKVTLRGPVDTAEEKRRIAEIAIRYALPGGFDDQLEVRSTAAAPDKPQGD